MELSLNRIINAVEIRLSSPKFRLLRSLYFNFRLLPFKQAIKLPIYLYGSFSFKTLGGKITINENCIHSGMVKIGRNSDLFIPNHQSLICIFRGAEIIFEGKCHIGTGVTIKIISGGKLYIGDNSGVKILCENRISIGKESAISFESKIMDTNFHYVIDMNTNCIFPKDGTISIGAYNWVGNHCVIMKGTKTADGTIIASGSFLNKNYVEMDLNQNVPCLLVGTPAMIKMKNQTRIFNQDIEHELNLFFKKTDNFKYIYRGDLDKLMRR